MTDDLRHGGAVDRIAKTFPAAPTPWVDLSTGVNPWPYPVDPASLTVLNNLPTQASYQRCLAAMALIVNAPLENIVLGPGSELLIGLLPAVVASNRVAILAPTYGDHARRWKAAGSAVVETDAPLELADTMDAVILCCPNNPDGRTFETEQLEAARKKLAAKGGFLIIDEAFADLDPANSMAARGGAAGLIVLKSFGKFYGLPGLRLGAVIAPEAICKGLSEQLGAWPVSSMALEIGARAYKDVDWQTQTRERLDTARSRLDTILKNAGMSIVGGTDLFRFVATDDATFVWEKLAEAGIYVRRFFLVEPIFAVRSTCKCKRRKTTESSANPLRSAANPQRQTPHDRTPSRRVD